MSAQGVPGNNSDTQNKRVHGIGNNRNIESIIKTYW